jgi:hypothetical protein
MAVQKSILVLAVTLLAGSAIAQAPDNPHAGAGQGVESLSAPLREALTAEMIALQSALGALMPALVAGRWDEVAHIGGQMRDSYILRQSLSAEQLRELHHALPPSFLELDERFHYLAGMLSHAAEAKKPELVGFYLGTLSETCVNCHARHARARFPAFREAEAPLEHHH